MDLVNPILLPFLIPAGVVVAFTVMQVTLLLLTGFAPGLDLDADVDVDSDVDVDVDSDAEADGPAEGPGLLRLLLTPLGVGQVPLSIIAQAFGLSWSVAGVTASYALTLVAGPPQPWFLALTLPVSALLGWAATRRLVRLVAPLLRISGRADSGHDLIGRVGVVTSLRADHEYGEVRLMVNNAPSYVYVRTQGEVLPRGSQVEVVGYDVAGHRPLVASPQHPIATSQGA